LGQAEPKTKQRILALALAFALAACADGEKPNTAVSEQEAAGKPGTLQQETPLAAIIRSRGVQPIKPASPEGLLPQIVRELAKTDPQRRYRGITYNYTSGNALSRDWLVQTPNAWGQTAREIKPDDTLPERLRQLIGSARLSVDIAMLKPAPDGAFLDALKAGIANLALSGRAVEIRLLIGTYPLGPDIDAKGVLEILAQEARKQPRSRLSFHVAAMHSCLGGEKCDSYTWNHAKFIAVDGERLFMGGHNFWAQDYFGKQPVHDLSLFMFGPAAADATGFANALWGFVCRRDGRPDGNGKAQVVSLLPGGEIGKECPARLQLPPSRPRDQVKILSVARLGAGITDDFANQNDLARDLLLGAATKSIFISQQDLGFTLGRTDPLWPESTLERLADFLIADKGDLFIVLSNVNARAPVGESYSNGLALESVAKKIRAVVLSRGKGLNEASAGALLCRRLHLAPLRFGPDASWPENKAFGNHAKFFMVDERAFYIGSDNFYPVNLQEFGMMIENERAVRQLKSEYWDKLWQWSGKAAISGSNAPSCVFQTKTAQR
jgi:phosphatidylserine/phosphatidylglycerophosphate/cardiolipin synthase-like enzyme